MKIILQLCYLGSLTLFMLGCDSKINNPTPNEEAITETEVHTAVVNYNQQPTISLSMLDATTPDNIWKQFFVEHGALECWEILQEREGVFYFDFIDLVNPVNGIHLPDRANKVAEAIIKYFVCHLDSILPKQLTFTTSEADKSKVLTYISPEIGKLVSLEELSLTGHDIQELPAEIGNLIQLEVLEVSCNQLRSLPAQISNLINLKTFSMHGNELRKLPSMLYAKFDELNRSSSIELAENKWGEHEEMIPFNNESFKEIFKDITSQIFPHSLFTICLKSIESYLQEYPTQKEYIDKHFPIELCQAERQHSLNKLKEKSVLNIDTLAFFKIIDGEHVPFYLYYPMDTYQDVKDILSKLEGEQLYVLLPSNSDRGADS